MSSTNNEIQVHKVQRFKQQKKKVQDQSQTKEEGSNTNSLITKIKCSNCGFQHQPRKCPAYGKTVIIVKNWDTSRLCVEPEAKEYSK